MPKQTYNPYNRWSEAFRKTIDNKERHKDAIQDVKRHLKESEINIKKSNSATSKVINKEIHCEEPIRIGGNNIIEVEVKNPDIHEQTSESINNCKENNAKNISKEETNHINILDNNGIANFEYESNSSNMSSISNLSNSNSPLSNSCNTSTTCPLSIVKDYNTIPKGACTKDATKLMNELQEIKKEVQEIKLELKINGAKKINNDFLHVTLQGIPVEVKNEDIIDDLRSKYFSVDTVYRLDTKNNHMTNEAVFQLPKNEDHIFYLSCCLGFEVVVEEYKDDFSSIKSNCNFIKNNTDSFVPQPIYVLIKGIPMEIPDHDVLRDLRKKHFHPVAVHSMITDKHREEDQTIVVHVPGEEVHIYALSCLLGFPVEVEDVNKGHLNIAQCKKCLQFGHKKFACPGVKANRVEVDNSQYSADSPTLNVVIKGVPIEFSDEIVSNHLKNNGFRPIAVHRMIVNDEILPSYLVSIPKQEKIFWFSCFMGFSVKVELFSSDLYTIDQCVNCHQFNHLENVCPNKKFVKELCNNDKTVAEDQTVSELIFSMSESLVSTATQTEFSNLELADSLNKLQISFQDFMKSYCNMPEKSCCCKTKSSISTVQASTSTEGHFKQINGMMHDVKSYKTCSLQFKKALGIYSQVLIERQEEFKTSFDIIQDYLQIKMSGITSTFVKAMITVLRSVTSVMLDIPDLPGVTINTINEQLHLLQELEGLKETLDSSPGHFTEEYEIHFPKLE